MLHMLQLALVALLVFVMPSCLCGAAEPPALPSVNQGVEVNVDKIKHDAKNITPTLPNARMMEEGRKAAKKAMAGFESAENRKKREQAKAVVQQLFSPINGNSIPKKSSCSAKTLPGQGPNKLPPEPTGSERVFVFLSSSMPEEALHAYISQAARAGDGTIIPVFYGFPGGLANKLAAGTYFAHLLQEDTSCNDDPPGSCPRFKLRMKINPILFAKYTVSQVPTVVFTDGDDSWKIAGDATLAFILERINGEAKSAALVQLINKLRGSDG